MAELLQFLISGVTVGAVYALIAMGFVMIFNASGVVNFAQGEFTMLGGMIAAAGYEAGWPLPVAAGAAIAITAVVGVLLHRLVLERARRAPLISLIIITIGASIFLRGLAQLVLGKELHRIPGISSDRPLALGGAAILPQSLWLLAGAMVIFLGLWAFFNKTLYGKAVLATANNRLAAQLMGINVGWIVTFSFLLSAAIGAGAGVLITPITMTSYGSGVALALKGFAAAILGGLGNPMGAVVGGLLLGLMEALTAGLISSAYKDAVAFIVILLVLFMRPQGLFGSKEVTRV